MKGSTTIDFRMITFDTYAWIEYLEGSKKGRIVESYVADDDIIYTPTICLAELKAKLLRDKVPGDYQERSIETVMSRSVLVPLNEDIALNAAEFKNRGLYMMDAVVYATALINNTKLLSGDKHFEGYEQVEFLA